MKKVVLFFILIMGVLDAKQIAVCTNDEDTIPKFNFCQIQKKNGDFKSINIYTMSGMYASGWRLITVVVSGYDPRTGYAKGTDYFFEK